MRFKQCLVFASLLSGAISATSFADVVTLKNGDKINGTVGQIADGKMEFKSPVLGDIKIDLANVESYTTDAPATIRMKGATTRITDKITAGDATKVETAGGKSIALADVKVINPPTKDWTGSILGNGVLARGNTDTFDLGIRADAMLRRDSEYKDDRLTLAGKYNFGTTGRSDATTTTTDNWLISGKYDKFWTEKLYGYVNMKAEHDRIALLNYRLTPGIGLGYQWIESPAMNFNTEVGLTYVYEDYDPGDNNQFAALRLAYHFDRKLADSVKLFHNFEILPAFEDPGDYILTTDLGVRFDITKSFFTEARVELKRDSIPAEGALKNDVRYIIGIGWAF